MEIFDSNKEAWLTMFAEDEGNDVEEDDEEELDDDLDEEEDGDDEAEE